MAAQSFRTSRSRSQRCYRGKPRCAGQRQPGRPSRNAAGVPATPARIPPSKSRRTRSASAVRATVPLEALEVELERLAHAPIDAGRPPSPGRRRSSPRAPRTPPRRPAAPRPRRRHGGRARGDACWPPESGGTRGAAAAPRAAPRSRRNAGMRGRGRGSASRPSPRTWSSGPTGGTPALVTLRPCQSASQGVEDQVRAGDLERRRRLVDPADDALLVDQDERPVAVCRSRRRYAP